MDRRKRKILVGVVVKSSGDKTVKVVYNYKIPHVLYKKEIRRKTVLYVHDELNQCRLKDKILIMETRPLSKLKKWRLIGIVNVSVNPKKNK